MALPKIKKRISGFILGEEGKISKQSLMSLGAFLGTGAIGVLAAKDVSGNIWCIDGCQSGGTGSIAKGCGGVPGDCMGWANNAQDGHAAYDAEGAPIVGGTGDCGDDTDWFHFNGLEFTYTGENLAAHHHHHGSHNSY